MEILTWTTLALLQTAFLPGFLVVRALGLDREGWLQTTLLSFGLSLTLNHLLVMLLVVSGSYSRPVMLAVLGLEGLAWIVLRSRRADSTPSKPLWEGVLNGGPGSPKGLALAAFAAVAILAAQVPLSATKVFEYWDVIASWNRWAVDWETGQLPGYTYHYPQLVPTTISLCYLIQGHPLQFAVRGLMALFPLGIALVFLDLGLRQGARLYLLASVTSTLLLFLLFGHFIGSGMADLPVAFMGICALYPLLGSQVDRGSNVAGRLAAAALLAVGCALTKQAGLYIALAVPILCWRSLAAWPAAKRRKAVGLACLLIVAGIAPWYLYADLQAAAAQELSISQVRDASAWRRLQRGLNLLQRSLGAPGLICLGTCLLASLLDRRTRWITLGITLPFTLTWALVFCYDKRNLALATPFLGWSAASGALVLASAASRRLPVLGRRPGLAMAIVLALFGIWTAASTSSRSILRNHEYKLVQGGREELNRRLLNYQRRHGFEGKILTDYRRMLVFESLREFYFMNRDGPPEEFWPFRGGLESFVRTLADPENDIRFVLKKGLQRGVGLDAYIDARLQEGAWSEIFEADDYRLLHILSPAGAD